MTCRTIKFMRHDDILYLIENSRKRFLSRLDNKLELTRFCQSLEHNIQPGAVYAIYLHMPANVPYTERFRESCAMRNIRFIANVKSGNRTCTRTTHLELEDLAIFCYCCCFAATSTTDSITITTYTTTTSGPTTLLLLLHLLNILLLPNGYCCHCCYLQILQLPRDDDDHTY